MLVKELFDFANTSSSAEEFMIFSKDLLAGLDYPRAGVGYQEAADACQGLAVPGLEWRAAPVFLLPKGLCRVGVHVDDQGLAGGCLPPQSLIPALCE